MLKMLKAFFSGLSEKERKVLYAACAFVFLALFDRLIYGPINNESKVIDEKIENQKIMIKKDLLILEYKDKILEDEEAHSLFYADSAMTHEELVAVFLREVEGFAKESNVALTNINPVTVEEKIGFIQYGMVVECTGNMSDMLNYIYTIESSKKSMRVYAFDISPQKRESYDVNCSIQIIKIVVMENPEMGTKILKKVKEKEEEQADTGDGTEDELEKS